MKPRKRSRKKRQRVPAACLELAREMRRVSERSAARALMALIDATIADAHERCIKTMFEAAIRGEIACPN